MNHAAVDIHVQVFVLAYVFNSDKMWSYQDSVIAFRL